MSLISPFYISTLHVLYHGHIPDSSLCVCVCAEFVVNIPCFMYLRVFAYTLEGFNQFTVTDLRRRFTANHSNICPTRNVQRAGEPNWLIGFTD